MNKKQIEKYRRDADSIISYGTADEQVDELYNLIDEILAGCE